MNQSFEKTQYGIVLVTAPSKEEAELIAKTLIQEKLAACVTILPVQSVYTWQGEIHDEAEWQLLIKSELTIFPLLEARISEIHSYEVPEIIAIPILTGSEPYLQWISAQVQHQSK